MSGQLGFYINSAECTGCKSCMVACMNKNDLPVPVKYRRVFSYETGTWQRGDTFTVPRDLGVFTLSMACNHCAKPACVEVCPTGAMHKNSDNGIVSVDQSRCIGCRSCSFACPYGAPAFREDLGVMSKCNLCEDLIAKGERPTCTTVCPVRALEVAPLDELIAEYGPGDPDIAPLPKSFTEPSIVLIPPKNAAVSESGAGKLVNLAEEV